MAATSTKMCLPYNLIGFIICETIEEFAIESSLEERTPNNDVSIGHTT